MPVVIGKKPDHDFSNPVGMLSDCHRRVERFLGVLVNLSAHAGGALEDTQRASLEAALKYFREAGPLHTSDEEDSLFPRLRALDHPDVRAAMAQLDRLEADHRVAGPLHNEVDSLGRQWLAGTLTAASAIRLKFITRQLAELYTAHIAVEESLIFPLAAAVLGAAVHSEVGHEMATRRAVPYASPIPRS